MNLKNKRYVSMQDRVFILIFSWCLLSLSCLRENYLAVLFLDVDKWFLTFSVKGTVLIKSLISYCNYHI